MNSDEFDSYLRYEISKELEKVMGKPINFEAYDTGISSPKFRRTFREILSDMFKLFKRFTRQTTAKEKKMPENYTIVWPSIYSELCVDIRKDSTPNQAVSLDLEDFVNYLNKGYNIVQIYVIAFVKEEIERNTLT